MTEIPWRADDVSPGLDSAEGAEGWSDEKLMDALRDDHSIALGVLLNRHWPRLVTFVCGFLDCRDAAEDIAQETFARLWESRKTWRQTGTVRSYLYRVARNLALNESRSRRVRRDHREVVAWATANRVTTPAEDLEDHELRRKIESAISRLPARRREIFIYARYHNLSYAEIADTLQIAPQTVANQMSAALAELRKMLRDVSTAVE